MTRAPNIKYSFKTEEVTSAHALLAPHVLNHEQGSKETFAFLSSRIILFSAAPSIIHSAPAAGAEHSWVTMPSSVTRTHLHSVPQQGIPLELTAIRLDFFFSPETLQLSLSNCRQVKRRARCLPAGMQPGMQHLWSLPAALFLFHHVLRHTGLAPQKSITLLEKYIH